MGKSSSSSKITKHSKDLSNKLRSVKKKKSKRNKSKKIRRIKESESSGSDSSLYSSSEDDYRRKKKRRSKLSKKRSRKRYSSSESDDDDDDDDRLLKKKKRSERKDEYVGKKKKKVVSRKRRKRDLSSSSTSSEQSDNDGSESDGKRRSRDRGRRLGEVNDARSRSRDGLEGESEEPDECWQVEGEVIPEKNPRRLKSIVVVSYSYGNDERKEEDDRDVYMTLGGNRELGDIEDSDERDGESTVSYSRTRADDNGREAVGYDEFGEYNKSETSKVSHTDNSLKDDDLEAILKKRALENLKRFRGVTQKSGTTRKEMSSVSEGEPLQIESEKVEGSQDHGLMEQKVCDSEVSKDLETSEKILHDVNVKESGTALASSASQQDQQSGDTAKVKASSGISSCSTKRKLVRPVLGKDSLNLASRKEVSGSQGAEAESIGGSTIDKNCLESTLALVTKNEGEHIEPTKVRSTLNAESSSHADTEAVDEIKGRSQSEQKMDETKDESQYEQKTMTVMRGGEMVQVSYKVYIPKKTSSLGRRKLNR